MNLIKNRITSKVTVAFLTLTALLFSACKNDDPSVLKIFIRSEGNELESGAQVVIIGDPSSKPATKNYVDTILTNASGFAEFNMDKYFETAEGETVGYFDIVAKTVNKSGSGYVRCRKHFTSVETLFLTN